MFIKKIIPFALVAIITLSTAANNTNPNKDKKQSTTKNSTQETIVGVAVGNENFSTLVAAVKAAGLVDVLNSDGPFTVFAPTNAAFSKLPEGTIATLLKPENKELLTAILTYHVVKGKFLAAEVLKAIKDNKGKFEIKTVQGNTLTASLKGGKVILTDAKGNVSTVVMTDVAASNGVIHAIDTVVMPK